MPARRKPPFCFSSLQIWHERKQADTHVQAAIRQPFQNRLKWVLEAKSCSPAYRFACPGVVPNRGADIVLRGRPSLRPRKPLHDHVCPPRRLLTTPTITRPRRPAASTRRGRGAHGRGGRDGAPLAGHRAAPLALVLVVVVAVDIDPHTLPLIFRPAVEQRACGLGEHLEPTSRAISIQCVTAEETACNRALISNRGIGLLTLGLMRRREATTASTRRGSTGRPRLAESETHELADAPE